MGTALGFSRFVTTALLAVSLVAMPHLASAAPANPSKKAAAAKPTKKSPATRSVAAKPSKKTAGTRSAANAKRATVKRAASTKVSRPVARVEVARPSFGHVYGLQDTHDALDLKSSVALVMDQDTNEVLFSKNSQAVLPIASITKLMTALVVMETNLSLDEMLMVEQDDVDTEKGSSSRLRVGTRLSRGEMLHLALMSSENRAANALGRHYPGGLGAFVAAMNRTALDLGMSDTLYVEPTGLSSKNQSSARDLATLVKAAHQHQLIRELSTSPEYQVEVGNRHLQFRNTNGLVRSPSWDIGLQKTGYISEAGRCLVMQAKMAGRKLIMVFLDSSGRYSRLGDAERIRKWIMETEAAASIVPVSLEPAQPNS